MMAFRCLAICQGLRVDVHYADDENVSLESFRQAIRQVCMEKPQGDENPTESGEHDTNDPSCTLDHQGVALSQVLVVSYDRKTMGQTGSGHFAPVAAYDEVSDSVLILDTARFKYGSHWVKVPHLYEALQPVDADAGRSRGYIVLTKHRKEEREQPMGAQSPETLVQPLKSASADEIRHQFLNFLETKPSEKDLSWTDFDAFWTRDDTDPGYVWYFCDPVIKPCQEELVQIVDQSLLALRSHMRQHVDRFLPEDSEACRNVCRPNGRRSIPLLQTEAIYLIYLATLERRFNEPLDFEENSDGDLLRATVRVLQKALFDE